ncbi:hypothetical protein K435DRAFT_646143 [Dendrothele bispora CBS 962.96]|uniref:LYR motif-containing protein Cup1-like N-terminal domain-containing protein n=1 Tax=Dendrothele bispora (strain CBS 962.96) TaxID=1314807 RepID=A0A4S8MSB3_DENBC|nr:hypothetical protein K435DRAFT_646143 [Dendrothele bispora CBS 962.96]
MQTSITPVYRSYLRQIRRLPHHYLRSFFRVKAHDDFRAIAKTNNDRLKRVKLKRVSQDLRKIGEALQGNKTAFASILDLAYGRRGKLKWEFMEPILSDPSSPPPEPIIPSKPKSRPPVYSREMQALLTTTFSRSTGTPLKSEHLKFPPNLPARADPSSEEARLLGPLSKRLEVNKRWRFFAKETRKILPPLEVVVKSTDGSEKAGLEDTTQAGIRNVGLQGYSVFKEIEDIVGPLESPRPITRRERRTEPNNIPTSKNASRHPSRWLRRRYQELLGRLPALIYNYDPKYPNGRGSYSVQLATSALHPDIRSGAHRRPLLDQSNLAWFQRAQALGSPRGKKT